MMAEIMEDTVKQAKAPINDAIIVAVAGLVDDAQSETREPSHSDLSFKIERVGLSAGDPKTQGQAVGKAKRMRSVLSWGVEFAPSKAELLVSALPMLIRGKGGFRKDSPNFIGKEPFLTAKEAFRLENYTLSDDGELQSTSLEHLAGAKLTAALEAYVRREQRGSEDAALMVGTGKDLLEATAAHVITEIYGNYSHQANLPTLLGQAFAALSLATPHNPVETGEAPQRRVERALYEAGCAVNGMRNKTGTGHGRPFASSVSEEESRTALHLTGTIAGLLLRALRKKSSI